jgi:Tfp pilus assembly protein PilF
VFTEWVKQASPVPRGLERIKTEVDVPAAFRVDTVIVAAGQRDQQELATIHLENGRRLAKAERTADAIGELRRAIYLAPYQHEAHLLLGQMFLRGGRLDEAIDELKISIWSQDTVPARLSLAEAFIAAHNTEAARTELQTVLARDPDNRQAGQLLMQLP